MKKHYGTWTVIALVLCFITVVAITYTLLSATVKPSEPELYEGYTTCQQRSHGSSLHGTIINISNTRRDDEYLVYRSDYQGSYLKVNENIPGTNTERRGADINNKIARQCQENIQRFTGRGINPYDPTKWDTRMLESVGMIPVGWADVSSTTGFAGPCLWCPYGNGMYIPTEVPLPYSSMGAEQCPAIGKTGGCGTNLSSRLRTVKLQLKRPVTYEQFLDCHSSHEVHIVAFGVQPNGGMQFVFKPQQYNRLHIVYLDASFRRYAADIVLEAVDVGGIAALNNGTILLISQMDCDAQPHPDGNAKSVKKAVLVCWKDGKLAWSNMLTDQYRKMDYDQPESSYQSYIPYPEGWGEYIGTYESFADMKYDPVSGETAVFFRVADGGGHWGSQFMRISATGQIVSKENGISHDMGGRIVMGYDGIFDYICNDDSFGFHHVRGRKRVVREMKEFVAGASPARLGSLIQRKNRNGFVLAYTSKTPNYSFDPNDIGKEIPNENPRASIFFLHLDTKMAPISRIPYFGNKDGHAYHYYNVHLMPYFYGSDETYLLFYMQMCCSTQACAPSPCFQLIRFSNNGSFEPVTQVEIIPNAYIPNGQSPYVCANGNLVWMHFEFEENKDCVACVNVMECCF